MSTRTKVITSTEELIADMDRLIREYPREAEKVLHDVTEQDIGPDTQEEVPRDTSNLADTWYPGTAVAEDGSIYIIFGYGTNYAFWVHEIPPGDMAMPGGGVAAGVLAGIGRTAHHPRPGQKWKYLEDPTNRHIGAVPNRMKDALDRMLTGGG